MRRINAVMLFATVSLLVGCAHERASRLPADYFLFNGDSKRDAWRSRYIDFEQVAKVYAKEKHIDFNFEGTFSNLWVFQKNGKLFARIDFGGRFGSPFFAVDIDPSGKVLAHYTGIV